MKYKTEKEHKLDQDHQGSHMCENAVAVERVHYGVKKGILEGFFVVKSGQTLTHSAARVDW